MNYLIERLEEPSTYAGIGVALGALGLTLPAGYAHTAALAAMAAAGIAAAVLKDGWRKAISTGAVANAVAHAAEETGDTVKG